MALATYAKAAYTCQSPWIPDSGPRVHKTWVADHGFEEYPLESLACRQLPNIIRDFEELQAEKQVRPSLMTALFIQVRQGPSSHEMLCLMFNATSHPKTCVSGKRAALAQLASMQGMTCQYEQKRGLL